jgi:hypothetical protein
VVRLVFCIAFLSLHVVTLLAPVASPPLHCSDPALPLPSGTPNAVQPAAIHNQLFINEVLLTPHSNWNCSEFNTYTPENDTWVELFNSQNQDFDLNVAQTTLNNGSTIFYLPLNAIIPAHGFLVLFPRIDSPFDSSKPVTLGLSIAGTLIDQVTIPVLDQDISYARIPDGSSTWQRTALPTIGASNNTSAATATPTPTYTPKPTHTPTPTHTPKPTHTPTPTHTPRPTKTSAATGKSTGANSNIGSYIYGASGMPADTNNASTSANDAQPAWPGLQLPSDNTSPTTPADQGSHIVSILPVSQTASNDDVLGKLLYSGIALILTLALYIGWRRYVKKRTS